MKEHVNPEMNFEIMGISFLKEEIEVLNNVLSWNSWSHDSPSKQIVAEILKIFPGGTDANGFAVAFFSKDIESLIEDLRRGENNEYREIEKYWEPSKKLAAKIENLYKRYMGETQMPIENSILSAISYYYHEGYCHDGKIECNSTDRYFGTIEITSVGKIPEDMNIHVYVGEQLLEDFSSKMLPRSIGFNVPKSTRNIPNRIFMEYKEKDIFIRVIPWFLWIPN